MITVSEPTREPGIGTAALILAVGAAVGAAAAADAGGWWWFLFAALVLVTASAGYGAVDSFQLRHRHEDGATS